ncbi:MAG: hypothetical protein KGQ46_02170 [Hyphomicrobiales bacterium]|nr:hypothetical protein [Hyphomicrobiales bacterium]MDE2116072.1 hypothetical protein [Hyphomicrobiales bacterium]
MSVSMSRRVEPWRVPSIWITQNIFQRLQMIRPKMTGQWRSLNFVETRRGTFSAMQERPKTIQKDFTMAIGNAVQRGTLVYVYDEKGRQLFCVGAGTGPKDGLTGYTSSTVNVRHGSTIYSYDVHGRQISMTSAR